MNSLTAHVVVSVLRHETFASLVLCKLSSHKLKDLSCFLETDELQDVHVTLEPHVDVLFAMQAHGREALLIIPFNCLFNRSNSGLLYGQCGLFALKTSIRLSTCYSNLTRIIGPTLDKTGLLGAHEKLAS